MNKNVLEDIVGTFCVHNGIRKREYDSIYYSTNEQIESIFSGFDFNKKDVLSVLGSGDQAFYFLCNGANRVDVFDQNVLTIYYYYLRIWCIKYLGDIYPDYNLKNDYLENVLNNVLSNGVLEKHALEYWNLFYEIFRNVTPKIFHSKYSNNSDLFDLNILKKVIKSIDFNFYNFNLFQKQHKHKKYDYIYTSNISEWIDRCSGDDSFRIYRDNLIKLLKKDGVVISSCINRKYPSRQEKRIMEKNFDLYQMSPVFHRETGIYRPLWYYYVKK